jgi:DNA gyrase/topoisomerase IV subunit A
MKQKALDLKENFWLKWNVIFVNTMEHDYNSLAFLTNKNSIKKIDKDLLLSFKKFPTICMWIETWEKLIKVEALRPKDKLWIISKYWMLSLFPEEQLRSMWKTAWWVKALTLGSGDETVDMFVYKNEPFIMFHGKNDAKLISLEDLTFWKWEFGKRWGKSVQIIESGSKQLVSGWISIVEWAVRLKLKNGSIETVHSNDISLDIPDAPMSKITNWEIQIAYRPRDEKEENQKYKTERKEDKKNETDTE